MELSCITVEGPMCFKLILMSLSFYSIYLLWLLRFRLFNLLAISICPALIFTIFFWFGIFLRHANYQAGITPLALVWKDENCSQYVIDTDSKGQVPNQQQVFSLASFASSHCFTALLSMPCLFCVYISILHNLLLWISGPHG